jgi:uncharacterized protein
MTFDWDGANKDHIAAHGVTPREVEEVFANDPMDLELQVINGEDRYASVGHTRLMRILLVVWTLRGEAIRPITAFDVNSTLAKEYLSYRGL